MKTFVPSSVFFILVGLSFIYPKIDYKKEVYPIIKNHCLKCHYSPYVTESGRQKKPKGKLILDTKIGIKKGGEHGKIIVPHQPKKSPMYTSLLLPTDDDHAMPPEGKVDPLTDKQKQIIFQWIFEGAKFNNWVGNPSKASNKKIK